MRPKNVYYSGKAHVLPERKDAGFDVKMESFNLNLPSALITGATCIPHSRSMGDFRSLSEDKKVHYEKNSIIVEVNLIKVFQNKRLSLYHAGKTRFVQVD